MSIEKKNGTRKWRLPAEWERQSMVQLTWPHAKTDWAYMLSEITQTYEEMSALTPCPAECIRFPGRRAKSLWVKNISWVREVTTP